jgi:hypothetical protein
MGRTEADRKITSELWSIRLGSDEFTYRGPCRNTYCVFLSTHSGCCKNVAAVGSVPVTGLGESLAKPKSRILALAAVSHKDELQIADIAFLSTANQ